MTHRVTRGAVLLSAFLLSIATLASGQETKTIINKAPIKNTSVTSGSEMFQEYCAACHGPIGKGDGPAASALKIPPADLSGLAKRHGGNFPDAYVMNVLENGVQEAKAHGSKDMPVWGRVFGSLSGGQNAGAQVIKMRILNITEYLKTLQAS